MRGVGNSRHGARAKHLRRPTCLPASTPPSPNRLLRRKGTGLGKFTCICRELQRWSSPSLHRIRKNRICMTIARTDQEAKAECCKCSGCSVVARPIKQTTARSGAKQIHTSCHSIPCIISLQLQMTNPIKPAGGQTILDKQLHQLLLRSGHHFSTGRWGWWLSPQRRRSVCQQPIVLTHSPEGQPTRNPQKSLQLLQHRYGTAAPHRHSTPPWASTHHPQESL